MDPITIGLLATSLVPVGLDIFGRLNKKSAPPPPPPFPWIPVSAGVGVAALLITGIIVYSGRKKKRK